VTPALTETAYAKINLALHVRERLRDGYHRIETLFAFCRNGDILTAAPDGRLSLRIDGPFAEGLAADETNLVLRAARALAYATGTNAGAAIHLDKRLPIASGIGGGSADAAAALRLLPRLWGLDVPAEILHGLAAGLGADVPACLASQPARGDGRGDRLQPADGGSGTPILLVNPMLPLSTAAVFAAWDGVDRGPLPQDPAEGRNDLQPPAIASCPAIADVLDVLSARGGTTLVRMSGSGATCFALFDKPAARDAAAAHVAAARPDWWHLATTLR
jgi:4-diphosphocytidyl-2-C-methyl-D-erythritol kinase